MRPKGRDWWKMVMIMKRILPYMLALTLLVSGASAVLAVEKKQKETPPAKKTEQPAKKQTAKPVDPKAKQVKPVKPAEPKKYDNFVDQNNNGVDDRRENLKKKEKK